MFSCAVALVVRGLREGEAPPEPFLDDVRAGWIGGGRSLTLPVRFGWIARWWAEVRGRARLRPSRFLMTCVLVGLGADGALPSQCWCDLVRTELTLPFGGHVHGG